MTPSRQFWMSIRQALLMIVDAIERDPEMKWDKPRTSELREEKKQQTRKELTDDRQPVGDTIGRPSRDAVA